MMPNHIDAGDHTNRRSLTHGFLCCRALGDAEQVTITGISDGHDTNTEELPRSSSKSYISPRKVVYCRLGQHGVVLNLRLAQWGAVAGDKDQLG